MKRHKYIEKFLLYPREQKSKCRHRTSNFGNYDAHLIQYDFNPIQITCQVVSPSRCNSFVSPTNDGATLLSYRRD